MNKRVLNSIYFINYVLNIKILFSVKIGIFKKEKIVKDIKGLTRYEKGRRNGNIFDNSDRSSKKV